MTAAIELTDLRKSFGPTEIIRGVNLTIEKGERHAIIGPNGAGKSTLFHLISGRYNVSGGSVKLHGENISNLPPYEIYRKGLSRSFQVTNIFPNMSVFENVRCGLMWVKDYKYSFWHLVDRQRELNERTAEVIEEIGLTSRQHIPAGVLTYAEQRALEIGISAAGGADAIMLDEPTAGMSHSETDQAIELIRKITDGKTLVMVEHDMGVVFDLADRISVLVYGEIIATDTPENIRNSKAVQEAYLGAEAEE
ncbi:ABC transporter ATP-binding protein [Sneathiella sp. HT1-7]|jgi:branched-chain amino acid transport system ATP-binding protein|uniref:ABC transporter ATP-binding protein n=1 Tax=Sneathiella sp. HT1-7 TaxID=2887192 RepID=UPI001D1570A2|nr:ABC transporter ATP-binding protein [Sneathiella sp. HT1-7]MCC3305385.1 ABC transporter ATP-binding protein [Sneathiella sp. HT1-7]